MDLNLAVVAFGTPVVTAAFAATVALLMRRRIIRQVHDADVQVAGPRVQGEGLSSKPVPAAGNLNLSVKVAPEVSAGSAQTFGGKGTYKAKWLRGRTGRVQTVDTGGLMGRPIPSGVVIAGTLYASARSADAFGPTVPDPDAPMRIPGQEADKGRPFSQMGQ